MEEGQPAQPLRLVRLDLDLAPVGAAPPAAHTRPAKVGRQELSYGDERIIGAFGWNNVAASKAIRATELFRLTIGSLLMSRKLNIVTFL